MLHSIHSPAKEQTTNNPTLIMLHGRGADEHDLLGFSMGAIMAYSIALTQSNTCKGIACLSGFAPLQLEREYKLQELQQLNIFISHGINDPVIPVSFAK